jgi:hypothetical protein
MSISKNPIMNAFKTQSIISSIIVLALLTVSCKKNENPEVEIENIQSSALPSAGFTKIDSTQSKIAFVNQISENENFNILQYEYLYNGGGVAIGDVNNDGLQDVYLVGNMSQDRLYLNKGDFTFEDITFSSGIGGQRGFKTGVNMIDINQDGFLDIYVCRSAISNSDLRANLLYINNGDLTFTEQAKEYGLNDKGYSVQAYFFDADLDGDDEVYVLNHPENMRNANNINVKQKADGTYEMAKPESYDFISDRYYVMVNGKYEDYSQQAGVLDNAFGLSAVVSDFNEDNLADIYVANDYSKPDRLWINQGNHTFKDEMLTYFKHTSFSSMGSDFSDLNNDLKPDLMVLDMMASTSQRRHVLNLSTNHKKFKQMERFGFGKQIARNVLQINDLPRPFSEIALIDNLATTDWSWNVLMADFDNDTFKDIHITNGFFKNITNLDYVDYMTNELSTKYKSGKIKLTDWLEEIPSEPTKNFFFKNKGGLQFEDVSEHWSSNLAFSNGAAYGDLNNDGLLDLVVNNINEVAFVLKNEMTQNSNNYLSVNLRDNIRQPLINTQVYAYLKDGTTIVETYNPQRGYLSSSQHRLHFGLGASQVDSLRIVWPDKTTQLQINPEANQILNITKKSEMKLVEATKAKTPIFKPTKTVFDPHRENNYNEFDHERLIDRSYSTMGPASLVFDFNADGLEDVFIGGAEGKAGKLYKQTPNGNFLKLDSKAFENDKNFEDVAMAQIDANQDKYPDLLITSASNEYSLKSNHYLVRLYVYKPDQKNYQRANFPEITLSASAILVEDLDNDGLEDVIIAGRNYPKYYPDTPKTIVLKQTQSGFENVTNQWLPDDYIGMVTDIASADLNNDKAREIIMTGEWMQPLIFKFDNGLKNITSEYKIQDLKGLWETIKVEDVNKDGYNDIILGNRGLNNLFKANPDNKLKLVYGDLFENNTKEYLMFYKEDGAYVSLLGLRRIATQIPALRKKFNTYRSYAEHDWSELLDRPDLKIFEADVLEHHVLLNKQGKGFEKIKLPHFTQNSIVKSILPFQHNDETYYALAGNHYDTDAEFSIYDASNGQVIKWNSSTNTFEIIPAENVGFKSEKDVRDLHQITINNKLHILVVNNNDKTDLFRQGD